MENTSNFKKTRILFMGVEINDNWDDLKYNGSDGNIDNIGIISTPYDGIINKPYELVTYGFVGKQYPVDYMAFTLNNAAELSFHVSADDAISFTIYTIVPKTDKKGITTYSLKSQQSSALKFDKQNGTYVIDTKNLLLADGTYYFRFTIADNACGFAAIEGWN